MIVRNAVRCRKCGDIIESTSRHDFKWCACGTVAVDGGLDYLRRLTGSPSVSVEDDVEELSEFVPSDDP